MHGDPTAGGAERQKNEGLCAVEGCEREAEKRGWCNAHYWRWRQHGDPLGRAKHRNEEPCDVEGCEREAVARGLCYAHYYRWQRYGDPTGGYRENQKLEGPCSVEGCDEKPIARGFCNPHYERWRKYGDPLGRTEYRNEEPCDVEGCEREVKAQGFCLVHYKRWWKHGDPLHIAKWTRTALLELLESLRPLLPRLTEPQLLAIIDQRGAMPELMRKFGTTSPLSVIKDLKDNAGEGLEDAVKGSEDIPSGEDAPTDEEVTTDVSEVLNGERKYGEIITTDEGLPTLLTSESLHLVDKLTSLPGGLDDEVAEYLVASQVALLWDAYLNDRPTDHLLSGEGGYYYNLIRSRFETEREEVENLPVPEGWSFRRNGSAILAPYPMQKLTAWQVLTKKRVGNWCGAGAGKTNAALLAIRATESQNALVVVANATVEGWARAIRNTFPDTVIHTDPAEPDRGRYNITILNYEKFQQRGSDGLARHLRDLAYDFVVLDEVQLVKQRGSKPSLRRETLGWLVQELAKDNPDLKVLGMSATPVINNLYEARKLLEIVQGHSFGDLDTRPTVMNALAVHRALKVYGFRYKPEYDIELGKPRVEEVVRNDLLDDLRSASGVLGVEQTLLPAKLEAIRPFVRKGTLLYTHYVEGMVPPIRRFLEGISLEGRRLHVGVYTGEDKSGLDAFRKGRVDVLIGSAPVATGVDGLQEVSNRIIVLSPPWTGAEYEQLLGRVWRQGSAFDSVDIIWPQVVLDHAGDRWSWDARRKQVIDFKRTLSDCAVDEVIPEAHSINPTTLLRKSREALEEWIERLSENGYTPTERPKLELPLPPDLREKARRRYGSWNDVHRRWVTENSSTVHDRLRDDPEEWYLYHDFYRKARENWPEVPAEHIARQLESRPDLRIGDFGCGECLLAKALPDHDVVGLDHHADNDSVIACDMAHTPLDDNSLDAAVFSLSLIGRNWTEYLEEAWRVLKPYGLLFIAEPAHPWGEQGLEGAAVEAGFVVIPPALAKLERAATEAGFDVIPASLEQRGKFVYLRAQKPLEAVT